LNRTFITFVLKRIAELKLDGKVRVCAKIISLKVLFSSKYNRSKDFKEYSKIEAVLHGKVLSLGIGRMQATATAATCHS
jgi:hypothetical protein